jgi:hypothetical protein
MACGSPALSRVRRSTSGGPSEGLLGALGLVRDVCTAAARAAALTWATGRILHYSRCAVCSRLPGGSGAGWGYWCEHPSLRVRRRATACSRRSWGGAVALSWMLPHGIIVVRTFLTLLARRLLGRVSMGSVRACGSSTTRSRVAGEGPLVVAAGSGSGKIGGGATDAPSRAAPPPGPGAVLIP